MEVVHSDLSAAERFYDTGEDSQTGVDIVAIYEGDRSAWTYTAAMLVPRVSSCLRCCQYF